MLRLTSFCWSVVKAGGHPNALALRLGSFNPGVRALNEQVTLKLGNSVNHLHGHFISRACEVLAP
jgi:hypothetical protein